MAHDGNDACARVVASCGLSCAVDARFAFRPRAVDAQQHVCRGRRGYCGDGRCCRPATPPCGQVGTLCAAVGSVAGERVSVEKLQYDLYTPSAATAAGDQPWREQRVSAGLDGRCRHAPCPADGGLDSGARAIGRVASASGGSLALAPCACRRDGSAAGRDGGLGNVSGPQTGDALPLAL